MIIHDIIFRVTFKGTDVEKKFRTSILAEDDLQAFYKVTEFAEKMVIVEIQSITPRDPVIAILTPKKAEL